METATAASTPFAAFAAISENVALACQRRSTLSFIRISKSCQRCQTLLPIDVFEKARLMTAHGAPAIGPGTPVLPAICPRDNLFFNEWGFHHRRPQVQAFECTTRSTAIGLPVFSSGPSTQLVWSQCSTNRNTIFVTKTGLPILLGW